MRGGGRKDTAVIRRVYGMIRICGRDISSVKHSDGLFART